MNLTFVIGMLLGMIGALMLNIGKGVQKQKVHIFLLGKNMFAAEHRRDLTIWVLAFALTGASVGPLWAGIWLSNSPSMISSMTGVGLIGLSIYAVKFIGEKINRTDAFGILLVIIGTSVLSYLGAGRETTSATFSVSTLIITILCLVGVAVVGCLLALKIKRIHGVTFGLTAGMCIGVPYFLLHAGGTQVDQSILKMLATPYPYVALTFGLTATFTTQVGFLRGRALEVVPAVNSAMILSPLLLEGVIYHHLPQADTMAFIALILSGVLLLSRGTAAKVSG
jgi:uncharacterized membrane protein YhaH (DUF805 family)